MGTGPLPGAVTAPAPSVLVRGLLLLVPPLVALLVYLDGQRYDPGLIDFANDGGGVASGAGRFFPESLAGRRRIGALRHFSKENLYEYINGHAEFYIGSGFQSLTVGEYGDPANQTGPQVTIDLFDMGKPLHAFGVLIDEAGEGAKPVPVGQMAFATEQTLTFINGRYYGKLSAFSSGQPLVEMATGQVDGMGAVGQADASAFDFPSLGQVTATRFIKENYRGMSFLRNVVERTFDRQGRRVQAFAVTGTAEEIGRLVEALTAFLRGEEIPFSAEIPEMPEMPGLVRVSDPYEGDWFFLPVGSRLLGVFGLPFADARGALADFVGGPHTGR